MAIRVGEREKKIKSVKLNNSLILSNTPPKGFILIAAGQWHVSGLSHVFC